MPLLSFGHNFAPILPTGTAGGGGGGGGSHSTLIGAFVGGKKEEIYGYESVVGTPADGYLAYNRDWYGTWEGLDPVDTAILNTSDPVGDMGLTGRYMLWSYGCYPSGTGYEGIRSIARGERYAIHKEHMQRIARYNRDHGYGHLPAYVRILWEAPGEWFEWGAMARDEPENWKEAFRQWAIAAHDADPSIKTVWDFNSDRSGPGAPELYPGDQYVDVISQDIYWDPIFDVQSDTGPNGEMIPNPVRAFNGHRGRNNGRYTYGLDWMVDFARQHGNKPIAVSEFGAVIRAHWPDMDYTTWYRAFFNWVDEVNASGLQVAYVTNWFNDQAGVGSFKDYPNSPIPHRDNIIAMHALRSGRVTTSPTPTPTPPTPTPTPTPPTPTPTPTETVIGTGPDILTVLISQDYYKGDAQFTVSVNGSQVGGTIVAQARKALNQTDTLIVRGTWGTGQSTVTFRFLNDLFEAPWTSASDRNLYVDGITYSAGGGAAVAVPDSVFPVTGESVSRTFSASGTQVPTPTPTPTPPTPTPTPPTPTPTPPTPTPTPPVAVPVVAAQSFNLADFSFPGFRAHQLQVSGGAVGGVASPFYVVGGSDAASFTVDDDGVVATTFFASRATKSSYTFTVAAKNAAGTGPAALITCSVLASGTTLVMEALGASTVPSNAPAGEVVSGVNYLGQSTLSGCSIAATTHPGLFTVTSSGEIKVASGAVLPQGQTVTLTLTITSGAFSDTEKKRLVIDVPEQAPVITTTSQSIAAGVAGRIVTSLTATGVVRTSTLVSQSHPGTFSLLSGLGVQNLVAIPVGGGPYWINVQAGNYGGQSAVQRVDLTAAAAPGANNVSLPEDTIGPA